MKGLPRVVSNRNQRHGSQSLELKVTLWKSIEPLSNPRGPSLLVSELVVVRALHTSALSENLDTAFKIRADSRNALRVFNAIHLNLN